MISLAVSDVFNEGNIYTVYGCGPPGTEFDTFGLSHFSLPPIVKM